jgi:hypothetical protein
MASHWELWRVTDAQEIYEMENQYLLYVSLVAMESQ